MPPSKEGFAAELKRARLAAGMSQAQVAEKAGVTGSYVCLLELQRKPAPSTEVVSRLAAALSIDEGRLQELAALERTPEPVKQRVLRLVRERGRVRRSRDALLTTTLFHMTRKPGLWNQIVSDALGLPEDRRLLLGRIAKRVESLPTLDQVESKSGEILADVPGKDREALVRVLPTLIAQAPTVTGGAEPSTAPLAAPTPAPAPEERAWRAVPVFEALPPPGPLPTRAAVDSVHVDRRLWIEGAFFLVADDDDAYPKVERGDLLLVHPNVMPEEGDLVVVRDGPKARIRIFHRREGEVRLESPRPDVPPIRVPGPLMNLVGVVAWIQRPVRGMPAPRKHLTHREERDDAAGPATA